jgi:hypothetical protein
MVKYNINILNQGQTESADTIIDRTFPDRLNSHTRMSSSDWAYFCDKIDLTLSPMANLQRDNTFNTTIKISVTMIIAIVLATIVHTVRGTIKVPTGAAYLIIVLIVVGPMLYFRKFVRRVSQEASNTISDVNRNLKNECIAQNERIPGVSFYVKSSINRLGIPSVHFKLEYVMRSHEHEHDVGADPDVEMNNLSQPIPAVAVEATPVFASVVVDDYDNNVNVTSTPSPSAPPPSAPPAEFNAQK